MKSFNGDYSDFFVLEMESELSESAYIVLDSLVAADNINWSFYNGEYRFSLMWGNGMVAPDGESPHEDRTFSLSFKISSNLKFFLRKIHLQFNPISQINDFFVLSLRIKI